mgnify:CR=1 FL=1|tara:strand:- start:273 stop:596 length:324 start_codon:yes stop_codon:yes gene_type:complete
MSIKVAVLQSTEQIIAEVKELMSDGEPVGYLFTDPHKVVTETPFLQGEEKSTSIQVSLSPWILVSAEKQIAVPPNHVVTVVEPIDSIKKMYLEKLNGTSSEMSSTEE